MDSCRHQIEPVAPAIELGEAEVLQKMPEREAYFKEKSEEVVQNEITPSSESSEEMNISPLFSDSTSEEEVRQEEVAETSTEKKVERQVQGQDCSDSYYTKLAELYSSKVSGNVRFECGVVTRNSNQEARIKGKTRQIQVKENVIDVLISLNEEECRFHVIKPLLGN